MLRESPWLDNHPYWLSSARWEGLQSKSSWMGIWWGGLLDVSEGRWPGRVPLGRGLEVNQGLAAEIIPHSWPGSACQEELGEADGVGGV